MFKIVAQCVLLGLALMFGSALLHLGMGILTNQQIAKRLKEYEQRWKMDDARLQKLEAEISGLEAKRDDLHAAAKKAMMEAAVVATEGMKKEEELRAKPLTPEVQAAANDTRVLAPERLGTGIAKGRLTWGASKQVGQDAQK